ncbi:MAG: alkaline phosphatase D family protein, partial [Verrucomicrobiales bacterium]|nr:alkaline phosphatase D family protein [Verrucomicrobiales bacterium]
EEKREYTAGEWLGQLGIDPAATPPIVDLAPTITGVWENYKLYLDRAPNLARWHRHVPTVYTADDHELVNDIYGSGTAGFKNRRAIFRDIALQAWHDYLAWANPVEFPRRAHFGRAQLEAGSDILTDPQTDFTKLPLDEMANLHVHWGGPNAGVMKPEPPVSESDPNHNVHDIVEVLGPHQLRISPPASHDTTSSYSIGRRCYGDFRVSNCHFLLVDTRTHRHLHNTRTPAQPGRQMLGEAQEKWLVDTIKNSDADFFFVVSSVNFMVPHVGTGGEVDQNAGDYGKDDAWTVFLDQRERLINFWDALPQPVFVLTGDLHNSFAIKITDNVYEFASGPHNSVNHAPMADEGGRPVNGTFQYGPRPCDIRWSTYALEDIPRLNRLFPHYCIVQVNNTFNNPTELGGTRPVAYPVPHVIFRFYDGLTGDFRYAETIHAATAKN